jgi:hypothetical protein
MIEIISFWFVIWFILYYLDIIKYNPLIFIIIAYVLNIFETIYLYMMTTINKYNLNKFIIINVIIKFIPIILLINKSGFIINNYDILFGIYLINFYLFLLIIFNKNPFETYEKLMDGYINNTNFKTSVSKSYDFLFLLITNKMSS